MASRKSLEILMGLGVCLASVLAAATALANVKATIDRDRIVEGETVTLILQTNDPEQSLQTDLSAVERDFLVLDQRTESQMSIVNGEQRANIRLVLALEPRRTGTLQIPPLQFPGARTAPLTITVEPAPELEAGELPPVFIEVEMEPENGPYYVLAQISLTVRIFYQQNLTEAAITPPAPEQASVRLLDEVPYQSTRKDQRYRVLERRYAVFPERSGDLVIPPMTLSGRLIERPADRLWQPSSRGRRVRVDSEPVTIDVLPKPAEYAGEFWLPARRLTLSQQISDVDELKVGEPVTRTVIVDAVGLEENMLEEPTWPDVPDVRIYPDQPQGISRDDGQWVLGHKEFRYAVVPEKAGELTLPEIRLDWWDTQNNQPRTAVIPEHRLVVAPSSVAEQVQRMAGSVNGQESAVATVAGGDDASALPWKIASLVLALAWLGTWAYYWRRQQSEKAAGASGPSADRSEAGALERLKSACRAGDARAARSALLSWTRNHGPAWAHGSVMELARGCDDRELLQAIRAFDRVSFSTAPGEWDGGALWKAFDRWYHNWSSAHDEENAEPDLYAQARRATA